MSYLALYRKYRPTTFDKLVGQEHIVKTLVNQLENDKIGHAYLFCGTRGTGKTSAAKIFSKAINCLSPINGSPCGKCEACRALSDPSNLDVQEIDAASNNGVNEIRELREKITYPPVSVRYKVYIIDEVHMLSTAAFNALLKTLEEPPKHAVFILATTESHKLPQTILSRCMRFDFKLISTERIASLIMDIYDDIGKKYEKEAVMRIAKAGEGSIRDALSIADICVSCSDGVLTYKDVLDVLGTSDSDKITALVKSVLEGDAGGVLESVNALSAAGKSIGLLTKDTVSVLRDLLVVRTCKKPNDILCLPEDAFNELREVAKIAPDDRILRAIEVFSSVESELKYSTHPRVLFETACVKAAKPESDFDLTALTARIKAIEEKLSSGNFTIPTKPSSGATVKPETEVKTDAAVAPRAKPDVSGRSAAEIMGLLTRGLRQSNELMLWAVIQGLKADFKDNTLIITAKNESDLKVLEKEENMSAIKKQLADIGDIGIKITALNTNKNTEKFDDDVDEIKRIFGDDIVIIK